MMQGPSFAPHWETVLNDKAAATAIFGTNNTPLRTFQEIEDERFLWRDRLEIFAPGSCLVAAIGNDAAWPALFLACLDQKITLVPIEPDVLDTQLEHVLELTRAQGLLGLVPPELKGEKITITAFERSPISWDSIVPNLLKITSGTTGRPRAVRTRETQLLADCRNICSTMGIGPNDINYGVIPFSHSYGFSNLITPLLYQGTKLVCSRDRLPRPIYEQILASEATVFPGTPALFHALSSLEETAGLGKVRLCISAGAPLQPEISRKFKLRFDKKIHSFYGSSECGGITFDRNDQLRFEIGGYVGIPMDGVELKAIESDRIEVHGQNVADGYFPDSDTRVLDGRRFVPGDLVEWIPEGLRLIGRASDVVNVAGKKVHPVVIEEHLRKHPDIMDAIVFGAPSVVRNEDLIAYVVGRANLSRKAVELHCRNGLSNWQVPREIRIVDKLPVNDRGKISRAALAQQHVIKGLS